MLKALRQYGRCLRAAHMWVQVIRHIQAEIEKLPIDDRGPAIAELRKYEGMLGNTVLRLVGVFPLDDGWGESN